MENHQKEIMCKMYFMLRLGSYSACRLSSDRFWTIYRSWHDFLDGVRCFYLCRVHMPASATVNGYRFCCLCCCCVVCVLLCCGNRNMATVCHYCRLLR